MLMDSRPPPLPPLIFEHLVRCALEEDLGRAGDITTDAIIDIGAVSEAAFIAREKGVIAGLGVVKSVFQLLDDKAQFNELMEDGTTVVPGDKIATVAGLTRTLLMGERTALNFLCRLSGIATATAEMVRAVKDYRASIVCTRKTTPGHRVIEKYAIRVGGGANHRFGLDDAMLIKDNHVLSAGGVLNAIKKARANAGHLVKIEVEVDTLEQLDAVLQLHPHSADVVMLDNFTPAKIVEAVRKIDKRILIEISGGVTKDNIADFAATGVDLISSGALTHSVTSLDIGLDFGN
tara:strand:+ start:749 stop:1621 length:873 start_codon:yes stop_codon:yes gene_type:complete